MENHLGKTIRILRQAKSLKVTELAGRSEVSVPYLSLVENGDRQPSLDVIRRIAKELGIPSEVLVVMGLSGESLRSSDKRTTALTDAVSQLLEIEKRLSNLLGKESKSGDKPNSARASRKGHGNQPK